MDEFQALLAKRSEGTVAAAPPEDEDEFSAVLAKRGKPGTPAATPAGEIPRDTSLVAPPASPQDANTLGKLVRGQGVVETAADLGDIVLGGVPAAILGSLGEVTQRLSSLTDGRGYREGGKAGAEFSRSMGEKFGRPLFDALSKAGLIDPKTRSVPMQAMDKVGGWLEHAATVFEADTGLPREDYLASINGFMAAMGVKGAQAMTQGALNRAKARGTKSAWDTALERMDAEEQLARAKFEEGSPNRTAAKAAAERPADDGLYGGDFAQQAAARREAYLRRKAYEKGVANFPPSGERTGSRGPVELNLEGKETPTTYSGNQPFHTADTTTAIKRGVVADTPIATEGRLGVTARPALDTGLEKVKSGRLFDMTMEERLAVKNSVDITDPKVITAAAVGATGLGLAMAYEPSAEEAALAIGAGALLRRGGVGESIRELAARPHATPIKAVLEPSAITTSTIEILAERSPNKFEFKKAEIEQLLKREGVTKHERDLMQEALASQPGDTITAKELVFGVRMAAKDFELTPVKSESYADYGLDRIDRSVADDMEFAANTPEQTRQAIAEREAELPEMRQRAAAPEGTRFDDYPYVPRQAQMVVDSMGRELTELRSRLHAMTEGTAPEEPVTRVYRSPLELGSNNHFSDPNYFAHTRSFVEDGVRHVVELQSDLAQKAGKSVSPEARTELMRTKEKLQTAQTEISGALQRWDDGKASLGEMREKLTPLQELIQEATPHDGIVQEGVPPEVLLRRARHALNGIDVKLAEVSAKLNAGAELAPISPMLKDWHKRLVREELADAARNLEPSVRFATADTVAKVEGWSDNLTEAQEGLRFIRSEFERNGFENPNLKSIADAEAAVEAAQKAPRFRPEHQGIYDRYSRDVEKFLRQLGGKPYTDSAGHTWLEVPLGEQQKALPGGGARTQIGGVDPQLAKAVAAVGGGAALAWMLSRDKDKVKHAAMAGILTGLGLLAYNRNAPLRAMIDKTIHGVQQLAGNLSTDKAVSAPLLRRFTEHARLELKGIHDSGRRISPFLEIANKVPDAVRSQLNVALANGRTSDIVAAIGSAATPGLLKEWNKVQLELKAMGTQLKDLGLIKDLRQDYFPRIVKDVPGLLTKLGKEAVPLQRALNAAEKAAGGVLDEAERAAIVNKFLEKNLRSTVVGGKASFFKRRTIDNVTIDLEPFYVEPLQALPLYMASAVRAIERAKFFGKDAVRDPVTGKLHLEGSIGNVVDSEIASGQMTPENFTRLTKLLETRFGPAYAAPDRPLRALSQVTNIALLGNVFSGMMNLADIGGITAQQGLLSTAAAVVKKYRGTHKITAADVGMADHIMEEFVYGTREPVRIGIPLTQRTIQLSLAKATDATFKFSGFKAFDQVMKEIHLNAAMENYSRMARSKAGEAKILRQYGAYFTTDMPQLLADLRAGQKTKLTTELAFRELSDAQPITKIEMPQFYLDHPNLRFGYALKSFAIKQLNLVKKRGVDEVMKGNVRDGMGFLIRYALLAGSAGAGMDWVIKSLLGRDADTDWGVIPFNVLKNIGISEYAIDKARQGKGKEAILMATAPPMDPVLNLITADPKSVRYFPLVGRLVYDRFMDGAEKANAAKKLAEKKKRRDAERTPEERRDLEQRALERRKELVRER